MVDIVDPRTTPETASSAPPQVMISWVPDHLPQRRPRTLAAVCVAFLLTPVATLGYGTPLLFSFAAWRRRGRGPWPAAPLWISAGVYSVVLTIGTAAGMVAGEDTAPSTANDLFTACLLITIGVGSLHALGLVICSAVTGSWPIAPPGHQRDVGSQPVGTTPSRQRLIRSRQRRETAGVLILGAFLSFVIPISVGMIVESRSFASHHQVTDGVVTDVREDTTCSGTSCTITYATTIQYRAPDGRLLHFQDGLADRPGTGTHLRVYYDTTDPGDARLDTGRDELTGGIVLLTVSMVLLLVFAVSSRRKARRSGPSRSARHGRHQ